MSRRTAVRALSTITVLAVVAVGTAAVPAAASPPGRYIVVVSGRTDPAAAAARHAAAFQARVLHVYRHAVRGYAADLPAGSLTRIRHQRGVVSVEADRRFGLRSPSFSRPARSWGVDRLDQAVNALDGQLTSASTGAGVTAYVVDTGIARGHAAFGGRAVSGANLAGAGPADDCNGHGTHVAGTIGGGLGLGVAPEVRLVAVKVLGCDGSGSVADVIAGVDWVSQDHRPGAPAVANMSLGGGVSATLDAAVRRSVTDGVVWTVAAGNDGADACSGSPSRVRSAIVVGATDQADRRAPWSDWGRCVDVFAPGVGILSAWLGGPTATRTLDGTSMAAPHVAGVAALYLSATPGASPARTAAALRRGARTGIVTDARSPHADLAAVVG